MPRRPGDWMRQAERDLNAAELLLEGEHFDSAAFHCQQAAEKALKALHELDGVEARGHSLVELVKPFTHAPPAIVNDLKILDKHYIQARYPNAHPSGAPADLYTLEEAERALRAARAILDYVRRQISEA